MAETIEYVVRLKSSGGSQDEDGESESKKSKSALTTGLEGIQKSLSPMKTAMAALKKTGPVGFTAASVVTGAVVNIESDVTMSLNRYFKLSENYKGQNYLSNIKTNIGVAKSMAGSMLAGAIVGSKVAGGFGAAAGAVISGATTGINQYLSFQNTVANFNSSMNATRAETNFRAERMGLYDGGKGTEN